MKMKTPKMPEVKTVRMPKPTDPEMEAAAKRTREAAMRRSGRMSTILSDQLQDKTRSSGKYLGG
jgi:hypothetical protein